ncbi:MAG: hypothetical protein LBU65_03630 [Planctomycetaceae bacterium]|nr:hypothetical protein [Planctomycetaceae bacterium]
MVCLTCKVVDDFVSIFALLGRCNACGCRVGLETSPIFNKIAMATEGCPLGRWNFSGFVGESERI